MSAPLDRLSEVIQRLVDAALSRSRARELDPTALYLGTVKSVRASGHVDVLADDKRITYVNDIPIFTGLPGSQVKPTVGARVLIGWSGGDKSQPWVAAFGMEPGASLTQVSTQASALVEWTVPVHRINGDSETEHDVGLGTLLPINTVPGPGLGGGAAVAFGTDCGFSVLCTPAMAAAGLLATVTFKRAFNFAPSGVALAAQTPTAAACLPSIAVTNLTAMISASLPLTGPARFGVMLKE